MRIVLFINRDKNRDEKKIKKLKKYLRVRVVLENIIIFILSGFELYRVGRWEKWKKLNKRLTKLINTMNIAEKCEEIARIKRKI